jgi:GABA(A) receptor-associated protein
MNSFKEKNPLSKRLSMSKNIFEKYSGNKIGIILSSSSKDLVIQKDKYITDSSLQISQFLIIIKKFICSQNKKPGEFNTLKSDEAIFLFVGKDTMPASTELLSNLYKKYSDEDGFLYITLIKESTFG